MDLINTPKLAKNVSHFLQTTFSNIYLNGTWRKVYDNLLRFALKIKQQLWNIGSDNGFVQMEQSLPETRVT